MPKISQLNADTSPTSDDLTVIVNDPAGTPGTKKATLANVITKAHGLTDGIVSAGSGTLNTTLSLDTDISLTANSDTKIATQKATKTYVDTGLATKEPTITVGTTGQYYRGDKTFQTLNATAVGLGNVTNNAQIVNGTTLQTNANFIIQSASSSSVGGIIRGATSQTASLQQWQNSAGTSITLVDNSGTIRQTNNTYGYHYNDGGGTVGRVVVYSDSVSTIPFIARGSAGQTGNLQEWQNSAGVTQLAIAGNGRDFILDTTIGSKIGTSTSQELGFWNATPIVQPTTSVAEAVYVENSGGVNVNDDSTFDGYTLRQVVKALRNVGLLA